jgi:hypothetical protein
VSVQIPRHLTNSIKTDSRVTEGRTCDRLGLFVGFCFFQVTVLSARLPGGASYEMAFSEVFPTNLHGDALILMEELEKKIFVESGLITGVSQIRWSCRIR